MELRNSILGFLSWKALSGYDLKRIIADSEVFYWSGNNNQIYKTLLELHRQGLVSQQVQPQEGLPARKVYSITSAGLQELRRSLAASPELPEVRKGFLIQLAWAELLPDDELLALLAEYEEETSVRLRMYQARTAQPGDLPRRSPREAYLWQQIAENLVLACQAELGWVRRLRRALEAKEYLQQGPQKEEKDAREH